MSKRQRGKRSGRKGKRKWRKECDTFEATLITEKKRRRRKTNFIFYRQNTSRLCAQNIERGKDKTESRKIIKFRKKIAD